MGAAVEGVKGAVLVGAAGEEVEGAVLVGAEVGRLAVIITLRVG